MGEQLLTALFKLLERWPTPSAEARGMRMRGRKYTVCIKCCLFQPGKRKPNTERFPAHSSSLRCSTRVCGWLTVAELKFSAGKKDAAKYAWILCLLSKNIISLPLPTVEASEGLWLVDVLQRKVICI